MVIRIYTYPFLIVEDHSDLIRCLQTIQYHQPCLVLHYKSIKKCFNFRMCCNFLSQSLIHYGFTMTGFHAGRKASRGRTFKLVEKINTLKLSIKTLVWETILELMWFHCERARHAIKDVCAFSLIDHCLNRCMDHRPNPCMNHRPNRCMDHRPNWKLLRRIQIRMQVIMNFKFKTPQRPMMTRLNFSFSLWVKPKQNCKMGYLYLKLKST